MNMTDAVYILSRQPCTEAGGAAALPSVWNHLRMRRYEMTWIKKTKVKHSYTSHTAALNLFRHYLLKIHVRLLIYKKCSSQGMSLNKK